MVLASALQSRAMRIEIDSEKFFVGDSVDIAGHTFYSGTVYNSALVKTHGLFSDDFDCYFTTCVFPNGGTLTYDSLFHPNAYSYITIYTPGHVYSETMSTKGFPLRHYDFKRKKWVTNSYVYDRERSISREDDEDGEGKVVMWLYFYIILPAMLFVLVVKSISLFGLEGYFGKYKSIFLPGLLALMVLMWVFMDDYAIWSLTVPVFAFYIFYGCGSILAKNRVSKVLKWLGVVSFFLLVAFQYLWISETVNLRDGTEIPLHWKRGTDPIKRLVGKNLIRSLVAVEGQEQKISTHELRNYEKAILGGENCSWFSFFHPGESASELSFKDAEIIIETISEITGNHEFALPLNQTFKSARGLEDLQGGKDEWAATSTMVRYISPSGIYYPTLKYGKLYGGTRGEIISPKSLSTILTGMRVAYGKIPYELPKVMVQNHTDDPRLIPKGELTHIDGHSLSGMRWDDIHDMLIEKSDRNRTYTIDVTDSAGVVTKTADVEIEAFTDPYTYFPDFTYSSKK